MFVPELEDRELSLDDDARLDGVAMSTEGAVKLGTPDPDAWMSIGLELNDITTTTANAVAIVDGVETLRRTPSFPRGR